MSAPSHTFSDLCALKVSLCAFLITVRQSKVVAPNSVRLMFKRLFIPQESIECREEGGLRTVQLDLCLLLMARRSTQVVRSELFLIFFLTYPMTSAILYFYHLSVNPSDDFTD